MTVRVRADTTRYYSATAFEQRLSTNLGQDCSCYVMCSEQSVATVKPQPVLDSDLIIRINSEYTTGQGLRTASELSKRLRDGVCRSYRISPFLRVNEMTENALGTCKNAFSLVSCRRTEASHNTGDMHGRPSTLCIVPSLLPAGSRLQCRDCTYIYTPRGEYRHPRSSIVSAILRLYL